MPKDNKLTIQQLLNTLDPERLTKEDFADAFGKVVETINNIIDSNKKEIDQLKEAFDIVSDKLKENNSSDLSGVKGEIAKQLGLALKEQQDGMNFIHDKVKRLRDGRDADETMIVDRVLAQIKLPEQKEIILDTPEQLRDKLEGLKGDEKIDVSAIKGLEDFIKDNKLGRVIMTGQNPSSMVVLTATGDVNGTNKTFTFAQKPTLININGAFYREDNGWAWSGADTVTIDNSVGNGGDIYGIL